MRLEIRSSSDPVNSKGENENTPTGDKYNFSIEILTDLLQIKEVTTLPPLFDYLKYKVQIFAH
jgi:hypothetical protein